MTADTMKNIIILGTKNNRGQYHNPILWEVAVTELVIDGVADIFGQRLGGDWIEIEIKTNLNDLINMERKKNKYKIAKTYKAIGEIINYSDYKYFCISTEISDKAVPYIKANYPQYGIYICDGEKITNVKRANRLERTKTVDYSTIAKYLFRRNKSLLIKRAEKPEGKE